MKSARLAWLSVRRRPVSAGVAAAGICAATLASSLLYSAATRTAASYERIETPFQAVVGPKSAGLSLLLGSLGRLDVTTEVIPYSLVNFIRRQVAPDHLVSLHAFGSYRGRPVFGTDRFYLERPRGLDPPLMVAGEWFGAEGEAVLGERAAREANAQVGDSLTVHGLRTSKEGDDEAWSREVRVAGIVGHGGGPMDDAVFVPRETGWLYHVWASERGLDRKTQSREATTYALVALSDAAFPRLRKLIHVNSVAQLVEVRDELDFLHSLTRGGRAASSLLVGCVLIVVFIGMTALVHLRFERLRPQLGLLRALGYKRLDVASTLTFEIAFVTAAAVAASIPLEVLAQAVWDPLDGIPSVDDEIGGGFWASSARIWGFTLAAALCASLSAVVRLYRTDVSMTLRGL